MIKSLTFSPLIVTYMLITVLMSLGIYTIVCRKNFLQNLIGVNLFQTSIFMFFIFIGKLEGGEIPIVNKEMNVLYSHPLPHVLILTAIVVGAAHTAVGIALLIRIYQAYGTIDGDMILQQDQENPHPIPSSIEGESCRKSSGR